MSSCNVQLDPFLREDGVLDVSGKYKQLMQDTLSDESLYIRAKDTMKVMFDDLQLTEPDKAKLAAEHVASMTTQLSASSMQTALQWATEERDGAYTLAKAKAETEVLLAQFEKIKAEICLTEAQTEKSCADITATISNSYRENGVPTSYDADGCKPLGLTNSGLKYEQTKQVVAATYQIHADAYRKSGVVQIGVDTNDNVTKGLSGGVDEITDGYTNQQTLNAERQRQAYEDSKINHMLNALGVITGQLLSAEVDPTGWQWLLDGMEEGVAKLGTPNSNTPIPFG